MIKEIYSHSFEKFSKKLNNYLFLPLTQGLIGFSIIFTFILISKSIGTLVGFIKFFLIEIDDLYLSLFGFITAILLSLPRRSRN